MISVDRISFSAQTAQYQDLEQYQRINIDRF